MKILFTVTNDLTYDQRMQRICNSLASNGYDIELVGRLRGFCKPLVINTYKQTRLRCFFNRGKLFYVEYNLRLFFYLLFHRADIICSIDLDTILPGYYVSKLKGIHFVYDAHEYFTEVPEVLKRPNVKAFWERLEGHLLPKIKHAYTVNSSIAMLFEEKYKTPFEVIYNAPAYQEQKLENHFRCSEKSFIKVNSASAASCSAVMTCEVTVRPLVSLSCSMKAFCFCISAKIFAA